MSEFTYLFRGRDLSASPEQMQKTMQKWLVWFKELEAWTASFTGASGKNGDTFTVRFGETFVDFLVAELIPAKRIVWRVTDCNLQWIGDKKEWKGTQVVFDLSSNGAATTVTMTHAGLAPGVECYEVCSKGWNFHITESLQKLLTENHGMLDRRESAEEVGAETR